MVLDVNRSLKRFPPGIGEAERPALQEQLTRLILRVILAHPRLHYYQGQYFAAGLRSAFLLQNSVTCTATSVADP